MALIRLEDFITPEQRSKNWRNAELEATDKFVSVTDHPDHTAIMAYRVKLRDWPSTDDFPDTEPKLGS